MFGEEFLGVRLLIKLGAFVDFPAGSVRAASGGLAGPILPILMARRSAKYLSTSIFLISTIAAPAVLLISSAAFIEPQRIFGCITGGFQSLR
jgi:hypothetical protein